MALPGGDAQASVQYGSMVSVLSKEGRWFLNDHEAATPNPEDLAGTLENAKEFAAKYVAPLGGGKLSNLEFVFAREAGYVRATGGEAVAETMDGKTCRPLMSWEARGRTFRLSCDTTGSGNGMTPMSLADVNTAKLAAAAKTVQPVAEDMWTGTRGVTKDASGKVVMTWSFSGGSKTATFSGDLAQRLS